MTEVGGRHESQRETGGVMKLDIRALALAVGLFWGAAMFLVGVANLIWPGYGQAFLQAVASLYPGYSAAATFGQVVVGALYGLADGVVSAAIFAWLYNRLATFSRPAA
jgi:hypothetical protein